MAARTYVRAVSRTDAARKMFGFEVGAGFAYIPRVSEPFAYPIDARTRLCAVYGHPVKHSASPAMQNAGLAALGLNWRYAAFDVHPDDLRDALAGAQVMSFIGLNLTVPHKVLAIELVDFIDPAAKAWGAVNTIAFEGRQAKGPWRPLREFTEAPGEVRSHGYNTDADAITRALREELQIELAGARVLLLGAGGAGRTAALKLASEKVSELYLVNRTPDKAEAVAKDIRAQYPAISVKLGYPSSAVDLVLNATSLGLRADDALPLDQKQFPVNKARAVYDMTYRPAETPLLKLAKQAGCRTANGLGMLLYQGAKALEIWTGQPAPLAPMREALEKNVYG